MTLIRLLIVFKSSNHAFLCFSDPSTTLAILAPNAGGLETCLRWTNQHAFRYKAFAASIGCL